jgi:hypothetical protein
MGTYKNLPNKTESGFKRVPTQTLTGVGGGGSGTTTSGGGTGSSCGIRKLARAATALLGSAACIAATTFDRYPPIAVGLTACQRQQIQGKKPIPQWFIIPLDQPAFKANGTHDLAKMQDRSNHSVTNR